MKRWLIVQNLPFPPPLGPKIFVDRICSQSLPDSFECLVLDLQYIVNYYFMGKKKYEDTVI